MLFTATHIINYRYDTPVALDPQTIRLKPQTYGTQQLLKFAIEIVPSPAGMTECRDLDGNMEHVAWFNGRTDFFKLIISSKVVTFPTTAFTFLLKQEAAYLPLNTDEVYRPSVKPYLSDTITRDVIDFSNQISDDANRETLLFLQLLTNRLHLSCVTIRRGEGPPYDP